MALPGFSMKSFISRYSICVSLRRWPFFSSVRLRVLSRKGPLTISVLAFSSSSTPRRRTSASTRAVSSAGEKGLVT